MIDLMKMKPWLVTAKATFFMVTLLSCENNNEMSVSSPDGKVKVQFFMRDSAAYYLAMKNDTVLIDSSGLGILMEDQDFNNHLTMVDASPISKVVDDFQMKHGKRRDVHYEGNSRTFHLSNQSDERMDIVFQVSNDGFAFRYSFPGTSDSARSILTENSTFRFTKGTTAFLQPMSDAKTGWSRVNPCYEEFYQKEIPAGTPSPTKAGWVYPGLFRTGNQWILITEAGLDRNYCATRLQQLSPNGEYKIGFPEMVENFPGGVVYPRSTSPWKSPWRVVALGSLKQIVESDIGIAFANKAIAVDSSFIKPGHSSWSWALLKDDSTVFDVQKRFIDYAAEMSWEYCLIDADWDKKIGYEKVKQLADHAKARNVGLLLWYNSAGDWNDTPYTPKHKLLTRESRAMEFSIKGVKIDFFGGDGQSMIAYYLDILEDAAKYNLLVNFHGATIPRGWHRTYPNLMSMEAIKGFEYVTFDQSNAEEQPAHCTILPFTRNAFDPMDFTPLSLDSVPRVTRRTTAGFELALSVILLSGIQHFVETPSGMKQAPNDVKEFLRSLPVSWDDTRFLAGYPGKHVVIARRSKGTWYIGGINGENQLKELTLDLSFIENKNVFIISDSEERTRIPLVKNAIAAGKSIPVTLKPNGGFVIVAN
jgi:alpha-glucosidase